MDFGKMYEESTKEQELLPEGNYVVTVATVKPYVTNTGFHGITVMLEIVKGDYKDQKVGPYIAFLDPEDNPGKFFAKLEVLGVPLDWWSELGDTDFDDNEELAAIMQEACDEINTYQQYTAPVKHREHDGRTRYGIAYITKVAE
jgi:hypothetical protein